jgi:hypothetical protein
MRNAQNFVRMATTSGIAIVYTQDPKIAATSKNSKRQRQHDFDHSAPFQLRHNHSLMALAIAIFS